MSDLLWVERYRPKKIADCILPQDVIDQAQGMVRDGNINHLLLCGPAGTGKTTLALAMCHELGADFFMYNGSNGELNIDELRQGISEFANTTSLKGDGQPKVIIIDEADGLSFMVQGALRNAMEKYAKNCRFILTCNYPDKIMAPLHSRCATIDYKFQKTEMNFLVKRFAMRTVEILKAEQVSYDLESIKGVVLEYFPDNRKILNELQQYSNIKGAIDEGILNNLKTDIEQLIKFVLDKNFAETKQWLVNHSVGSIFNELYKAGERYVPKELQPLWIMTLAEAQRYHGTVPNQELNVLGALTNFMAECP